MLKAKLDSVRKNKKGFSLVELIIVVAIMVALIAVLAPSYVKYVNKSRDAALQSAAEDVYTAIKTELINPNTELSSTLLASTTAKIYVSNSTGNLVVSYDNFGNGDSDKKVINDVLDLDSGKAMKQGSINTYTISLNSGKVTIDSGAKK